MKPESKALITQLLDDVGAHGTDRAELHETLTELVEAVIDIEAPRPMDPDTKAQLQAAIRQHPELGKALAGEEVTP